MYIKNVKYFCNLTETAKGYLIYTGQQEGSYTGIQLTPFEKMDQLFNE